MSNLNVKSFKYGKNIITLENGFVAKKSDSSIIAKMDDTVVLVTIVKSKNIINSNFLPITVNYYERMYSVGKFPGGFFKRELRQTENEIIISRLIDRSIRPLFIKNYKYEIQIIITVMSIDPNATSDILSIIAVSAALMISDIPFNGPVFAFRIGYIDKKFILNPSYKDIKKSDLDLIVSTTNKSIIMIESSSNFLSENKIIDAINFGNTFKDEIINNIKDFCKKVNKNKLNYFKYDYYNNSIYRIILNIYYNNIYDLYNIYDKVIRKKELDILKKDIIFYINKLVNFSEDVNNIESILNVIERDIVRNKILKSKIRIDGRKSNEIRDLNAIISFLPRVHGSCIFTRGETQAIVSVTLGGDKDSQNIDNLFDNDDFRDKFIFHYNFPPYCVGETGSLGFPKRREIGHGKLAKKSLLYSIPDIKDFPYTIRIVSEITESNGSSSMASVCGATLALMDAGVPIKSVVVGISMGLITKDKDILILTDISGDEDFFGDIDFKISGNKEYITTLQMDIKSDFININIIKKIFVESKLSRIKIIEYIKSIIPNYKSNLSIFAPRINFMKIDKNKIGDLIGKGGKNIKLITNETKSIIDIDDNGIIKITSNNKKIAKITINKIKEFTEEVKIGNIYFGTIKKILSFGVLVSIKNNIDGLIHISYLNKLNNNEIKDDFYCGQKIYVKISNIDINGKIRLILIEKINIK